MGQTDRERWHGKVAFYPGNTLVGPDCFHGGPDFLWIDKGARGHYRWEYIEGAKGASETGRWTLVGPLKASKGSRNSHVDSHN